jgi:hypothetical protein
MPWTPRPFRPGRVYAIALRESHPRGRLIYYGWIVRPDGWRKLAAEGWVRSVEPIPKGKVDLMAPVEVRN